MKPIYCTLHGRIKEFSHNTEIGGVKLGVYVCPHADCASLPDFGKPDGADNYRRDDDDDLLREGVAA